MIIGKDNDNVDFKLCNQCKQKQHKNHFRHNYYRKIQLLLMPYLSVVVLLFDSYYDGSNASSDSTL